MLQSLPLVGSAICSLSTGQPRHYAGIHKYLAAQLLYTFTRRYRLLVQPPFFLPCALLLLSSSHRPRNRILLALPLPAPFPRSNPPLPPTSRSPAMPTTPPAGDCAIARPGEHVGDCPALNYVLREQAGRRKLSGAYACVVVGGTFFHAPLAPRAPTLLRPLASRPIAGGAGDAGIGAGVGAGHERAGGHGARALSALTALRGPPLARLRRLVPCRLQHRNHRKRLSGPLPDFLASTGLVWLDAGASGFSGSMPSTVSLMTSLQTLILLNNSLSALPPISLASLSALGQLDLSRNNLTGPIPPFCASPSYTRLRSLRFSGNELSGRVPASLGMCELLENLFLDNNRLSGSLPATFRMLRRLRQVRLERNSYGPTAISAAREHHRDLARGQPPRRPHTARPELCRASSSQQVLGTAAGKSVPCGSEKAVPCGSEKAVWDFQGLPWLEPHERNL
ncbi:unnamed protein product [Closterium sp. Naga37s-1]|nr:unnamed protein product [Closterium sp. Naga37s-1]